MLTSIHPKLPMRIKSVTQHFYMEQLGFEIFGTAEYDDYLMLQKDEVQLHFFLYRDLNPLKNYGQVYIRVEDIETYYRWLVDRKVSIHPNGQLEQKPWGQKEFSLLDPDHNLLTFGQSYS